MKQLVDLLTENQSGSACDSEDYVKNDGLCCISLTVILLQ